MWFIRYLLRCRFLNAPFKESGNSFLHFTPSPQGVGAPCGLCRLRDFFSFIAARKRAAMMSKVARVIAPSPPLFYICRRARGHITWRAQGLCPSTGTACACWCARCHAGSTIPSLLLAAGFRKKVRVRDRTLPFSRCFCPVLRGLKTFSTKHCFFSFVGSVKGVFFACCFKSLSCF